MHTNATLHVHPAAANPSRIFEIRRLARLSGCAYVAMKPKLNARYIPPSSPDDGGRAA
jgi:hypothetical protein